MVSSVHKERGRGGSTLPVSKNRTDTTIDDHSARTGATERGKTNEWGGIAKQKQERIVQKYKNIPQLSSSFRPATLTELLLCRFIAALLIAVILLFPTRVPGESLVPIVLEGAPVIVDDRGLVVGGTLEDSDPFRVVELCGVPLVRFLSGLVRVSRSVAAKWPYLFLITSVLRDCGRTTPCSFCVGKRIRNGTASHEAI